MICTVPGAIRSVFSLFYFCNSGIRFLLFSQFYSLMSTNLQLPRCRTVSVAIRHGSLRVIPVAAVMQQQYFDLHISVTSPYSFFFTNSLSPVSLWSSPGKASLTFWVLIVGIHSEVQCGIGDCRVLVMLTSECPCSCMSASCSLRWLDTKPHFPKFI